MERSEEVHVYLEVELTAPAEAPTVDSGGSRMTEVWGSSVCSMPHAHRLPTHFSKGTEGRGAQRLLPSCLNPFLIHLPHENQTNFSKRQIDSVAETHKETVISS